MLGLIKCMVKGKKGDLEFDELGKLIIGLVLLILLIIIVTVVIRGELFNSGEKISDAFSIFK